jgi:hypothetical protein
MLMGLKPTFAGRVIDIVTAQPDTDEGRAAALKAVNHTILEIVAVIIIGYVCIFDETLYWSKSTQGSSHNKNFVNQFV